MERKAVILFMIIIVSFVSIAHAEGGEEIYVKACSPCHGMFGEGTFLGPSLRDKTKLESLGKDGIKLAITHGRGVLPEYKRTYPRELYANVMPAWKEMKQLNDEEINKVTEYIIALWLERKIAGNAEKGGEIFSLQCAFCHGAEGEGTQIAPQLNDRTKLEALGEAGVIAAITHGRGVFAEYPKAYPEEVYSGVMPAWENQLSAEDVENVVAYIFEKLGGIKREVEPGIEMWPWEVAFIVFGAIWVIIGLYYVITWW